MSEQEQKNEGVPAGAEIVPVPPRRVTDQQLEDAGLMMPTVDPSVLRAAFQKRMEVLTSILDPNRDFVYTIHFVDREGGEQRRYVQRLDHASELATATKGTYTAHPRKSGVLKLAQALGIECRLIERIGLPNDPRAEFSSVRYMATHTRTGRKEEGIGACYLSEKKGLQRHACISLADTRGYTRAVLRCAGYDNVGAEEMESVGISTEEVSIEAPLPPVRRRPPASLGDGEHYDEPVAAPAAAAPVPAHAHRPAHASPQQAPATQPMRPATQPAAQASQTQAPASPAAAAPAPDPVPISETSPAVGGLITNAQAGILSDLLLQKLGSFDRARGWLKERFGIERSIHLPEHKLGEATKALEAMEVP